MGQIDETNDGATKHETGYRGQEVPGSWAGTVISGWSLISGAIFFGVVIALAWVFMF